MFFVEFLYLFGSGSSCLKMWQLKKKDNATELWHVFLNVPNPDVLLFKQSSSFRWTFRTNNFSAMNFFNLSILFILLVLECTFVQCTPSSSSNNNEPSTNTQAINRRPISTAALKEGRYKFLLQLTDSRCISCFKVSHLNIFVS